MAETIVNFTRAVRKGSHVLVALYGESGSGKTLSGLYIARGLVGPEGKIAMLDTETGRGLVYASEAGGFDHAELTPPFTPERYVEAIKAAEDAGYEALIVDSCSHEWEGIGGVLETAESSNKQGLVKWANPKARHKRFVQALLATRMHLILCLRAKEKMVQKKVKQANGSLKDEIVSEGFVSVQDKRFIFEMTVQVFMQNGANRGVPIIEKCPRDLLPAFPEGQQVSIATGERIREWVAGGSPIDHELEALKKRAEDEAEKGADPFRQYWAGLAAGDRAKLKPYIPNLQSIAKAADDAAAEEARKRQEGADDFPGDRPAREVA